MRILAIDTATEACSAALWNDGTLSAHFRNLAPREHTQRILPLVQEVLTERHHAERAGRAGLWPRSGQLYRRAHRHRYRSGAGAGRRTANDWRFHADTPWRRAPGAKPAPPVCWRPLMRVWAKSTGPSTSADEQGRLARRRDGSGAQTGSGSRTAGTAFPAEWATVGTGWQAWPDPAKASGLTLKRRRN